MVGPVCVGVCEGLGVPDRVELGVPVRVELRVPVRVELRVPVPVVLGVPVWLELGVSVCEELGVSVCDGVTYTQVFAMPQKPVTQLLLEVQLPPSGMRAHRREEGEQ